MTYRIDEVMKYQYPYVYAWGNNEKRSRLIGQKCRIISKGKLNSIFVEFEDRQKEIISGNAIRKINA